MIVEGVVPLLRQVHAVVARLNAQRDLPATLRAVAEGVLGLGFGAVAVNVVRDDGDLEVVAVAGPDDVQQLLGGVGPRAEWERMLEVAIPWGPLRYVPHSATVDPASLPTWAPPSPSDELPDWAWHPDDALFAPLHDGTGQLLGVLSVDLPDDGRVPGPVQRELLEMFAVQAAIALDNARLRAQTEEREELFRRTFEDAPIGLSLVSPDGRFLRVNNQLAEITGRDVDELLQLTFRDVTHPDDVHTDLALAGQLLAGERSGYQVEKRYLRPDGAVVPVMLSVSLLRDRTGQPRHFICQVEDITLRKAVEAQLTALALRDPLTGLANRAHLEQQLATLLRHARRGRASTLLFADLDGFKEINDSWGHEAGDHVLRVIAERLRTTVRETDTVGRLGGDEFVILAGISEPAEIAELTARVRAAAAASVPLPGGSSIRLGVSIGIAPLTAETLDPAAALREADSAMYQEKRDRIDRAAEYAARDASAARRDVP